MDILLMILVVVVFAGLRLWSASAYAKFLDEQPEEVRSRLIRARDHGC